MNDGCSSDNEGEEEVEGKETSKGCVIYREAPSDSLDECVANVRHCGE